MNVVLYVYTIECIMVLRHTGSLLEIIMCGKLGNLVEKRYNLVQLIGALQKVCTN